MNKFIVSRQTFLMCKLIVTLVTKKCTPSCVHISYEPNQCDSLANHWIINGWLKVAESCLTFYKDQVRGEEEEENCPVEGGRTEERNIWYLVRCYTVRGQWHLINRIWLACVILYTVYTICWALIITVLWVWPWSDQSVRTMVRTSTFSKYFVGSGANSMHTHVVWSKYMLYQKTCNWK